MTTTTRKGDRSVGGWKGGYSRRWTRIGTDTELRILYGMGWRSLLFLFLLLHPFLLLSFNNFSFASRVYFPLPPLLHPVWQQRTSWDKGGRGGGRGTASGRFIFFDSTRRHPWSPVTGGSFDGLFATGPGLGSWFFFGRLPPTGPTIWFGRARRESACLLLATR